ncbi:hypothetical protein C8J30_1279 [Rhodobacter viridis]|uniref:Uncharacterized protein n=1 Tax=Rhodobacter viridis TaxID=1054202 RepID=A0A318TRH1_9RHOB|nr:hypothetical protein [Rhodobacter viridis]PYF06430.1 hypothetical protein C8J30_1279 [Rhodobacter viridis]
MTSVTQKMQSAARIAFVSSVETDSVKYNKAVAKLAKDWAETLTFHHFPAQYRKHIRHVMKMARGNTTEKFGAGGRFCWRISP